MAEANSALKFDDLDFGPHSVGSGVHATTRYDNGYGASVVQFTVGAFGGSYGVEHGLYELAVIKWEKGKFSLTYETPITDDVLGGLSEQDVTDTLHKIAELPEAP